MLSRGRCRYGLFDLSRLPQNKRGSALRLQLQAWTPYVEPDFAVVWRPDGRAMVWAWDASALKSELASLTGRDRPVRLLPETLLQSIGRDGLRLLAGLDGFEVQQWGGGVLTASRWWSSRPSDGELSSFIRDCGPLDSPSLPWEFEQTTLRERPWGQISRVDGDAGGLSAPERVTYAIVVLALGAPALVLAVDQIKLTSMRSSLDADLEAKTERAKGWLEMREQAMLSLEQSRAIYELQPFPQPLVHMAAIARALPQDSLATLKEWELSDGRLRVLFSVPSGEISGSETVRVLERTGLFSDVKILGQGDPRQMAFSMQLKRQTDLALPTAAASAPN